MLRNYFLLAIRNFMRQKVYAGINIVGLTVGLTCAAFVVLFILHETRYDTFHKKSDRIYRLNTEYRSNFYSTIGFPNYFSSTAEEQLRMPEALRNIPGVKQAGHFLIYRLESFVDRKSTGERFVDQWYMVTNTGDELAEIFDFNFIKGDPETALAEPNSVVLTQSAADKIFGDDEPMGEILTEEGNDYKVTGIIEDWPEWSHVNFPMILTMKRIPYWGAYTYLLLDENTNPNAIKPQLVEAIAKADPERVEDDLFKGARLQALTDIHLHSDTLYEIKPPGNPNYVYTFGAIGLLILLITSTNYMNLSIAMYSGRNTEIGMRKVAGASRWQLAGQFLFEAMLLSLFCVPLALGLFELTLPLFNNVMDLDLQNEFIRNWKLFGLLIGMGVFLGLASGIYPALILSTKKTVNLFQNTLSQKSRGLRIRQLLVTFQLILLIGLGSLTWLVNKQLNYIQTKDLGFPKEQLLRIPTPGTFESDDDFRIFRKKILAHPNIVEVGMGRPPGTSYNRTTYKKEGGDQIFGDANSMEVDYRFMQAMDMHAPAFEQLLESDLHDSLIFVNQAMVDQLELEDPEGKIIITEPEYEGGFPRVISGVVDDKNFFSLKEKVRPILFEVYKELPSVRTILVRFKNEQVADMISTIETAWYEHVPNVPFAYEFLDENLAELYKNEERAGNLGTALCLIAVLLSVLGLVGMTAFLTGLRTKEIGVRKIMGASPSQIVFLMSKEFVRLVIIATLVASPIAFLVVRAWLEEFAYRIEIPFWIFGLTGILALLIAFVVVGTQTLRAATNNPAHALRQE